MIAFKPGPPPIYERMERGEVSRWLGLSVIIVTWVLLIIPVLCLTFPIWGSVAAYRWITKVVQRTDTPD
jgi:predicted PurR-regulated permease PerM